MPKFVELFQLAQFLPFWKDQGRDKKRPFLAFLQAEGIVSSQKIKGVKLFQKSLAFKKSHYSCYMWHIFKNCPWLEKLRTSKNLSLNYSTYFRSLDLLSRTMHQHTKRNRKKKQKMSPHLPSPKYIALCSASSCWLVVSINLFSGLI